MKRIFMVCMFVHVLISYAHAVTYNPFLVDGRIWNYDIAEWEATGRKCSLKIDGDTIFKNVACKKIYYIEDNKKSLYAYSYEDGGKVYFYFLKYIEHLCGPSQDWQLIFDFTLNIGDEFCSYDSYLHKIDTIEVRGNKFIRFWIGPKQIISDRSLHPIIYSIGGILGLHNNTYYVAASLPMYTCSSVYDGDKCIFESSDYRKAPISTDIEDITTSKQSSSDFYDLQGRKVKKPTKGLYIKDGKKVVVR